MGYNSPTVRDLSPGIVQFGSSRPSIGTVLVELVGPGLYAVFNHIIEGS